MPKFAANLSMLFTELPFLDRFAAAARAGFTGVEFMFPYDHAPEAIAERLKAHGLSVVLFNLPPGDWAAGSRGRAIFANAVDEFLYSVEVALRYAKALDCKTLHCLAGIAPDSADSHTLNETYIANLRAAARILAAEGITLVIEPINTVDIPGYFLTSSDQAIAVIEAVGAANLAMQYDLYHMHIMGENLEDALSRNLARIRHVQFADAPGRHEPGTGVIPFDALFAHLDRIGYAGWVGLEYRPSTTTEDSLAWLRARPV